MPTCFKNLVCKTSHQEGVTKSTAPGLAIAHAQCFGHSFFTYMSRNQMRWSLGRETVMFFWRLYEVTVNQDVVLVTVHTTGLSPHLLQDRTLPLSVFPTICGNSSASPYTALIRLLTTNVNILFITTFKKHNKRLERWLMAQRINHLWSKQEDPSLGPPNPHKNLCYGACQ